MELQAVEFYAAKMIRLHGFQEETRSAYHFQRGTFHKQKTRENFNKTTWAVAAPSQELVMKWFREKYNIFICPIFDYDSWDLYISNGYGKEPYRPEGVPFKTYEEAAKVGIQQAIKICNLIDQKK